MKGIMYVIILLLVCKELFIRTDGRAICFAKRNVY